MNRQMLRVIAMCPRNLAAHCLAIMAVLFLAAPHAAQAQARSFEELARADPADVKSQADYVQALKAFAARQAKPGSPLYWQIIQANLARDRRREADTGERALGGGLSFKVPPESDRVALDAAATAVLGEQLAALESGDRIFGGRPTTSEEFKEVVSLATQNGDAFSSFCSGTLIAPDTVLTAAHCVCDSRFNVPKDRWPAVVFGSNVNSPASIAGAFRVETWITMDPTVCSTSVVGRRSTFRGRDLAAVKFKSSEPLRGALPADGIKTAPIASWRLMFGLDLDEFAIVGFGRTEDKKLGEKRFTTVPIADKTCTAQGSVKYRCEVGKEAVAVDYEVKRDTCGGDSGGPAFIRSGLNKYYLVGATSGGSSAGACGTGGVYSLITPEAIKWLSGDVGAAITLCEDPTQEDCKVKFR